MSKYFRFLLPWFALLTLAATASQTVEQKPVSLPEVSAYNLEKTKVVLPSGFSSPLNLLVLFFDQDQRKDALSWLPVAAQAANGRPNMHAYLMPVYSRQNLLYRWWMNSSMRSSTPDTSTWKWTVPLYLNKQDFKQRLSIHSEKEVTVLLVDKSGKVLWRSTGPLTPEKRASFAASLNEGNGR